MSLFYSIAPSGYCIKQHAALRSIQYPTSAGHQVNNVEAIVRRCERFAGTETGRLEDLNPLARLVTPNTIVLSVRGGYGISRLLADIDWQALVVHQQHDPLLICGHGDFTAIQCDLLTQGNVITSSGPTPVANFGADELNTFIGHYLWLTLRNKALTTERQGKGLACQTEGTLWGGNLAMLILLIGTPWVLEIKNGALVSEDISKHPFRVERMLLWFYHVGILPCQKVIILGSFSSSTPNDYGAGYNLESVYAPSCSRLSVPLVTGLDFGHEQCMITLPLGAHTILNNTQEGTQLTISGCSVLKI